MTQTPSRCILGGMKKLNLSLTERHSEILDVLFESTGLSRSDHIRRALDDYFRKLRREGALAAVEKGGNGGNPEVRNA